MLVGYRNPDDQRDAFDDEGYFRTGDLAQWVDDVIAAHPAEVARYRGGEVKLIGFFVGQVMKKSGGKADPKGVQPVLQEKLK